jgi:hypothetical protein
MPRVTIHRRPEISDLGMPFVQKRWRKRPYAFYERCRVMQDLQLWYSALSHFSSKILRKTLLNEATPKGLAPNTRGNAGVRDVAPGHVGFVTVRHRTRTPRPARVRWSMRRAPFFPVRDASRPVVGATRQTPTRR